MKDICSPPLVISRETIRRCRAAGFVLPLDDVSPLAPPSPADVCPSATVALPLLTVRASAFPGPDLAFSPTVERDQERSRDNCSLHPSLPSNLYLSIPPLTLASDPSLPLWLLAATLITFWGPRKWAHVGNCPPLSFSIFLS